LGNKIYSSLSKHLIYTLYKIYTLFEFRLFSNYLELFGML